MFMRIFFIVLLFPHLIFAEPIDLTDKTWKVMLTGQWMVEFYAPWCSACKQFKPVWNDFSQAMVSKNIKVAAVDVDQYPSLSGRFRISALPTVYYVHDGVFRQYTGERSLKNLKKYIDHQDWQKAEPLSSYFGPNSILMSLISSVFDISIIVKDTHRLLQDYYGWPSWIIYTMFVVGVLCLGILIGFGFLQIIDYCLGSFSKGSENTVPEDTDELDEDDSETLVKSKQPTTDESQNDEEVESDQDDNSVEAEEEQQTTTDQTVRQRRLKS